MFNKILILNRGEIAVRIERTCREMGIQTIALFEAADQSSLHVRLADETVLLPDRGAFTDADGVLRIAREKGADGIHPGYGFLAEEADFIRDCDEAGIVFIGPPADVVEAARDKISVLKRVRAAGFPTVEHSSQAFDQTEYERLEQEAEVIGYPVAIKSVRGGRGRGERMVRSPERLAEAVRRARTEAQAVYGDSAVYLEKAVMPAHQVAVQIIAYPDGSVVHAGEREGSLIQGNQKIVMESPAPCLDAEQRSRLCEMALQITRLFHYQNVGSIEFLVDEQGNFYFTEIKARIPMEHPLTEMVSRMDLIREQIQIAAGEPQSKSQQDIRLEGWAMEAHLRAEDPSRDLMPSPGRLRRVRLPSGPEVRVDTYVYSGADVPSGYDPVIGKFCVWGPERRVALQRLQRVLDEIKLTGTATNVALLQQVVRHPDFVRGVYSTQFLTRPIVEDSPSRTHLRDLAVAGAIFYARSNEGFRPTSPERIKSGWPHEGRRLPE